MSCLCDIRCAVCKHVLVSRASCVICSSCVDNDNDNDTLFNAGIERTVHQSIPSVLIPHTTDTLLFCFNDKSIKKDNKFLILKIRWRRTKMKLNKTVDPQNERLPCTI